MTVFRAMDDASRHAYLNALGVQRWRLRDADEHEAEELDAPSSVATDNQSTNTRPSLAAATMESMQAQSTQVAPETRAASVQENPTPAVDVEKISRMDLADLQMHVSTCQVCALHKTRKQTVFGTGHHKADWLIIGEAPGADEDREGEPFVGRAGQLLTQMLRAIGLAREEVFIANILKCRPPNNRDPKAEEVIACQAYLQRQIELLEPKIVLVLGRIAAQALLNSDVPIGKMRGKLYHLEKQNVPVIVTYHPAYLLRSPKEKRKVWEDLKFARQQIVS